MGGIRSHTVLPGESSAQGTAHRCLVLTFTSQAVVLYCDGWFR